MLQGRGKDAHGREIYKLLMKCLCFLVRLKQDLFQQGAIIGILCW